MFHRFTKSFVLVQLLTWLFSPPATQAQAVYKTTDSLGKTTYSSGSSPVGEPTNLPSVTRENIDARISALKSQAAFTCAAHGGIDCSKGQDSDGSVICADDFREASIPFRFRCLEAKLTVKGPYLRDTAQENASHGLKPQATKKLQITLRNTSDIPANELKVSFIISRSDPLPAQGPDTVEPFGIGDYTLFLDSLSDQYDLKDLKKAKYSISCRNCVGFTEQRD